MRLLRQKVYSDTKKENKSKTLLGTGYYPHKKDKNEAIVDLAFLGLAGTAAGTAYLLKKKKPGAATKLKKQLDF